MVGKIPSMEFHPIDVRSGLRQVLATLGVWVGLGIFMGVQFHLNGMPGGRPVELGPGIALSVRRYLIYALLTLPILWLCRRFPPTSSRWIRPLTAHAVGLTLFVLLYTALQTRFGTIFDRKTFEPLPASLETARVLLRSNLFEQFTMYASIVTAVLALQYHREHRRRELREAELRRQMAEYELQVLKLQIPPHFLFNAMNGIATLMTRDTKIAREMLLQLSELLRTALSQSGQHEIPLREEIAFVKAYLDIQRMRFGERLTVSVRSDRESLEASVPNMIIQPLVENAIQHGIARMTAGGGLELATERVDGRLRIVIVSDGPQRPAAPRPVAGSGIGLGNARARLSQLYGDAYQLRLVEREQGGAELLLEIPYHTVGTGVAVRG